jgi:hypothetical protein
MRLWGLAVAGGHVVLGLVGDLLLHVPGALLFFGLSAALTLAVALITAPLLRPRRPPDDSGDLRRDDPEPPPWWPEFEREFRAYASRPRTRA